MKLRFPLARAAVLAAVLAARAGGETCARSGSLPTVALVAEIHSNKGPSGRVREELFRLAQARRILLGSEANRYGGTWARWNADSELNRSLHGESSLAFPIDSEAWVVQDSYKAQARQLADQELSLGKSDSVDIHVSDLFRDPVSSRLLQPRLCGDEDAGLRALCRLLRAGPTNQFVPFENARLVFGPLSRAERSELATAVHRLLVEEFQNEYASRVGSPPLVPLTEDPGPYKVSMRHEEQIAAGGESRINAIRSLDFARELGDRLCSAPASFAVLYAVVGATHAEGVEIGLRKRFGAGLKVQHIDSQDEDQAARFLAELGRYR